LLTKHAIRRYVSLNLDPDVILDTVRHGKKARIGRTKWSASRHTKRGTIVVTFAEYLEFIRVITITKGGKWK
jgi:hypothetical protein